MNMEIYTEHQDKKKPVEIHKGEHNCFTFTILSLGSHPTAYIQIPKGHPLFEVGYDDIEIEVHGGLTYAGLTDSKDVWEIGWDYAHSGDYYHPPEGIEMKSFADGKRWTKEDIIKHCKDAIDQIPKLKKFQDEKYYFAEEKSTYR